MKTPPADMDKIVAKEFAFLKAAENLESLFARGINLPTTGGLMVPLSRLHRGTEIDVRHQTPAGLEEYHTNDHRCLFLVYSRANLPKGSVGLSLTAGVAEVRDLGGDGDSSEMAESVRELVRWTEETLWPERIHADRAMVLGFFGAKTDGLPVEGKATGAAGARLVLKRRAGWHGGERMILTAGPSVSAREAVYSLDAAKYGWNDSWSKYLKAFEKDFASYIGVRYALATSSCTGALHLALAALGIGPGDEVIVPDITWVATGNAVLYVGATPIFADVDPETWCLDVNSMRSKITPRTKAVMPVHLYGHPCKMDEIMSVAREHNLFVVEDAAPSIGAEFQGRRTGSFGHFSAFSFQGAKLAVTGEGGMLLTDDETLYRQAYTFWDQGRVPGTFWIQHRGLKYKMSNLQAAFGMGQLERNDGMVEAKRRVFRWYEEGLRGVPHISLNREASWARSIYWMSSMVLHESAPIGRDELMQALKSKKIDTRPVFPAISQYPIWPVKQEPQPVAFRIGQRAINLPSGVCLAREDVDYVCAQIRSLLGAQVRPAGPASREAAMASTA